VFGATRYPVFLSSDAFSHLDGGEVVSAANVPSSALTVRVLRPKCTARVMAVLKKLESTSQSSFLFPFVLPTVLASVWWTLKYSLQLRQRK
jgi:hypothetical protein